MFILSNTVYLFTRGSADATRNAHNLVTVLLRDPDKEFESFMGTNGGGGKKGSAGSSNSSTNTAVSAATSQPPGTQGSAAQPQDTMSSIGTFSIADFIVTTQVCLVNMYLLR